MRWFFRRRHTMVADPDPTPRPYFRVASRRYRADATYILPNDLDEVNRLDFQHYMMRYAMQGLYMAPIRQPLSILDVGTGTGRWAREMAHYFPQAKVVGIDLKDAPMHSGGQVDPPNATFLEGNVLTGLSFADGSFDYVHQRFLNGGMPERQWPADIHELVRLTRMGGWIESGEPGVAQQCGPALTQLNVWLEQIVTRRDINLYFGNQIGKLFQEAGLQQVKTVPVHIPMGAQGGRLGIMAERDYFTALRGLSEIIAVLGVTTVDAFDNAMQAATAEMTMPTSQTYWPFYFACGQRVR